MSSLGATYTSLSASQTFSQPLPAILAPPSTGDRVAYLSKLQSATKELQSTINTFLTQKMEEEKAAGGAGGKFDDAKEEENYGEEVADDE